MFIYAGSKQVRKRLGWVADFCPVCRDIRSFRLEQTRKVAHLYGISLGGGKVQSHDMTCESCGMAGSVDPARYESAAPGPGDDPYALAEVTHPNVTETHAARLELEDRLAEGRISESERAMLLREPFLAMDGALQRRLQSPRVDGTSWTLLLLGVAGISVALAGGGSVRNGVLWAGIGVLFSMGFFISGAVRIATDWRRYVRDVVEPTIVRSLAPLRPTTAELEEIRRELKVLKLKIAYVKVRRLGAAFERVSGGG